VDGSAGARPALEFAVREAGLRGATLVALMAVELPDYAWIDPYALRSHPEATVIQMAEQRVRAMLSEVDTHGAVVEVVVTTASAPAALVERSRDADLLVVGSRGHGGFRGLVMGSVSLQCMLHAHCPVTVVRPEPQPRPARHHTVGDARRETTAPFI